MNCSLKNNTEGAREVKCTLWPLREVWMKVGMEKLNTHEGVIVKALLDSGAMGIFMDKDFAEEQGFKLEKLDKPVEVKNVDGTDNNGGKIEYKVQCNMYFEEHVERIRVDICKLGKTKVILGMPWLAAHNPEIDWEKGEVKMMRCPPWCTQNKKRREERKKIRAAEQTVEKLVLRRFWKWRKVFGKAESERMPVQKPWDHAIELKEGFIPRKGKVYSLCRDEREEVQAFVEDQLRKGYIWPSKSPQISPVHFVAKKDGKRRMVQDYQHINEGTIKNAYPLPLISDILDGVGTRKVFTKLDLCWGYNNVRIKEDDEWKAAFTTHIGSYELMVMYFSLTNLPATFQTMMNNLFRDMVNQGSTATFIDDIIVITDTEEGHDEIVEEVLRRLEENNLFVKLEKCRWRVREVEFLGVVIGPEGVRMQKETVDGVLSWPTPRSAKDVQKFIGLANYYRRFIQDFSRVAKPLNILVGKDRKWEWGAEQQGAFEELKKRFTTEPVLAVPDRDQEMRVEADALDYATGGTLSVKGKNGRWRPVAFISKSLSSAERNYKIHDKEMLAVIRCLEDWRHYLEGTKKEFKIWTDHKNLQYFMSSQKLNHRQARWALYLSRFNFALKHVPGKSMGKVDSLSRRPDWQVGVDRDNCHKPPLWLSPFLLFFSLYFLFYL